MIITRATLHHLRLRWLMLGAALAISLTTNAETLNRQLAEAEPFYASPPPSFPARLDFKFGEGRALLRRDGTWEVEEVIVHGGFTCGNYRLGVRYGQGNPGCLDVNWFGDILYGIQLKHCNNAERPHRTDGFDSLLADVFEQVTCAERVIRCTGSCSLRQRGILEPGKQFGQ